MDRIQSDPKLASVLLPQRVVNAQLASLRTKSPTKHKKGSILVSESELAGSRDVTPQSSPSKSRHSNITPSSSPSKHRQQQHSQSQSPGKLVLNPQNPHLKKMRSNQALNEQKEKALSGSPSVMDEKMPGGKVAEPGMEHVGLLSEVLYGRWTEGLKGRWPLA